MPPSRFAANLGARIRLTKRPCLERTENTICTRRPDLRLAAGSVPCASTAAAAAEIFSHLFT